MKTEISGEFHHGVEISNSLQICTTWGIWLTTVSSAIYMCMQIILSLGEQNAVLFVSSISKELIKHATEKNQCPCSAYLCDRFMACFHRPPPTPPTSTLRSIPKELNMSYELQSTNLTKWATSWENLFMPYANNKGQISLHICAVWSAPLLFAVSIV